MIQNICVYCGEPANFLSINTKKWRCCYRITQCPGLVDKMLKSKKEKTTFEERSFKMKEANAKAQIKLQELRQDEKWLNKKKQNISLKVKERGGHKGANNPSFGLKRSKETREKQSIKANNRDPECYVKGNETRVKLGLIVPAGKKSKWIQYKQLVEAQTKQSWKKYQPIVNPEKLTRSKELHLDHKFSIYQGFLSNVPVHIIASPVNLELISRSKNSKKHIKCSVTLEELMQLYEEYSV